MSTSTEPFAWAGGREAALRETEAASLENRVPFAGMLLGAVPDPDADDGYSIHDLAADLMEACEPFPMPRSKKKAYVFGLGDTDWELMLRWAMEAHVGEAPPADAIQARMLEQEVRLRMEAYQVVLALHKGPRKNSGRCFKKADVETVRALLSRETIAEICRISNALGGNEEQLSPGVRDFLSRIRDCLQTWRSAYGTVSDCPAGLAEETARLGQLASRALSRGRWDSGMSDALARGE